MRVALNRPVIVENKAGAGGRIGVQAVKDANADGSVLLFTPIAPMAVFEHVYDKLGYDPVKDFAPVSQIAEFDLGIAVGPSVQAKSIGELVEWIKANPNQGAYGSPAAGSLPHFFGVLFGRQAALDLRHVAYSVMSCARVPFHERGLSVAGHAIKGMVSDQFAKMALRPFLRYLTSKGIDPWRVTDEDAHSAKRCGAIATQRAVGETGCLAGDNDGGGGIQHGDVAQRHLLASQHLADVRSSRLRPQDQDHPSLWRGCNSRIQNRDEVARDPENALAIGGVQRTVHAACTRVRDIVRMD